MDCQYFFSPACSQAEPWFEHIPLLDQSIPPSSEIFCYFSTDLRRSSGLRVHRLIPLYLHFYLPIIVVMKIWFRIGAEQSGPQSPAKHPPSDTKTRLFRPFTLSICEGGRISGVRSLHPGRFSRMRLSPARSASFRTALLTRKSLRIEGFFAKWAPTSNRKWPKNRCYRKQRSKPCLTEARTHFNDFSFLATFAATSSRQETGFNPPLASYLVGANLITQRA